jgi:hypothetical protein
MNRGVCNICGNGKIRYGSNRDNFRLDGGVHAKCVRCVGCDLSMSSNPPTGSFVAKSISTDKKTTGWVHEGCNTCPCGQTTDLFYDREKKRITHTGCRYNPDMCSYCGTVIGIELWNWIYNPVPGSSTKGVIHRKCQETISCSICGIQFTDTESVKKFANGTITHRNCSPVPCLACHKPGGTRTALVISGVPYSVHVGCVPRWGDIACDPAISKCGHRLLELKGIEPPRFFPGWSPGTHVLHTAEVQSAILTILLIKRQRDNCWALINNDVLWMIFRLVATPHGWGTVNKTRSELLCSGTHCPAFDCWCGTPSSWFAPSGCTGNECAYYTLKCRTCSTLVPIGSNPIETCTEHRCITQTCNLCNGALRFGPGDSRKLCDNYSGGCMTWSHKCYRCPQMVPRIESQEHCSQYRCSQERCGMCGFELSFVDDRHNEFCTRHQCRTLFEAIKTRFNNILKWLKWIDYPGHNQNKDECLWYSKQTPHLYKRLVEIEDSLGLQDASSLHILIDGLKKMIEQLFN